MQERVNHCGRDGVFAFSRSRRAIDREKEQVSGSYSSAILVDRLIEVDAGPDTIQGWE